MGGGHMGLRDMTAVMSQTERLGFFAKTASGLASLPNLAARPQMAYGALLQGGALPGAPRRRPSLSMSFSDSRSSSLFDTPVKPITAEALRQEFAAVDARIEDVRQKSRKFSEPGRAELGARRREPRAEEDEEGAAPRPERATRNPQASVMRKVAQMREGLEATGAASPVPMMRLAVQREAGVERVPVVDVLALKSRSLVSEGERSSAKSLLEKRRQQERLTRIGSTTLHGSRSQPALFPDGRSLCQLSWEDRLDMVRERRQRMLTERYMQRMNSRRERDGPPPDADQFEDLEDY